MKITYDDFRQYTQNAPQYSEGLIFVQSGIRKEDVLCMVMWLRRLCQATDGLSFMLITSSYDSKDGKVRKKRIYSGKAGRPKTITEGTACRKDTEKKYRSTRFQSETRLSQKLFEKFILSNSETVFCIWKMHSRWFWVISSDMIHISRC